VSALVAGLFTGGCQCGAVRYRATARHKSASICHCRMCQKAVGGYFAALCRLPDDRLTWTRGQPAVFASSDQADRGFCRDCGTPLFYRWKGGGFTSVTLGSLDDTQAVAPNHQFGIEGRVPFLAGLASLPGDETTEEEMPDDAPAIAATNHQHPDHDTDHWP